LCINIKNKKLEKIKICQFFIKNMLTQQYEENLLPVTKSLSLTPKTAGKEFEYFVGKYYWYALILLVALTVADNVLVVILFDTFGERYSQYINQGTAFVYIVWSSLILLYRRYCSKKISSNITVTTVSNVSSTAKSTAPKWVLIGIGLFNGTGNFLMAISQPHTPGLTQTLLNLLGIPLVLILSSVILGKLSKPIEWFGAFLIVAGSCMSGLRIVLQSDDAPQSTTIAYLGSVMLYASAQLFLSGEKVWEEWSFTKFEKLDAMLMFWYTLVTQFMLGWFLYPLQTFPSFGNISLVDIPSVIEDGIICTFGDSPNSDSNCGILNPLIFFGYCSVDFWCYFFGLWVIQRGGANLMVVTIALALPLQQLVLCTHFLLGKFSEAFFWGDTVALVLVMFGFLMYQYGHRGKEKDDEDSSST
jgi:drug/metabolite transporter (DMT)-like permease